jgi:hypothetical protein
MQVHNLNESLDEDEKEYGIGGGDRFKFSEGLNQMRALAISTKPIASYFLGKGRPSIPVMKDVPPPLDGEGKPAKKSLKRLMYIFDHKSKAIKLVFMPYTVVKAIAALQADPDWTFEGFPMPYDIKVTYNSSAAPNDKYKVLASPNRKEVTDEFMESLNALKPLDQIRDAIQQKNVKQYEEMVRNAKLEEGEQGHGLDIDTDDIQL